MDEPVCGWCLWLAQFTVSNFDHRRNRVTRWCCARHLNKAIVNLINPGGSVRVVRIMDE